MAKLIRVTTIPLALNTLLRGQMKYMKENGLDVIMVSADGPEREAVIKREGCPHHIIPMTRAITPFADLRSLWKMYRYFKKEKPDIVHSHTPKAGLIGMMAARMAGVKTRIHTIAGLRFMTSAGMTRKILVRMEKLTAACATHVWPNSRSLKEYVLKNNLARPSKVEVIAEGSSNGIDLARFNESVVQPEKLEEIKGKIGYDPSLFYFVSVGRIVKDKGMEELSNAFARLYKENGKVRLLLLGDFEDEQDPVTPASREILMNHPGIFRMGWTADVPYYLHLANVLVHPSYREGFPNVLLQAGAMNCAVICSRITGNVDIVDDGETGLICEVKDENSLFEKMKFAVENVETLANLSSSLYKKVHEKFDQRVVHQALLKKYQEILV
jgi:glycosyltransferase involved in cell wall biosynthesis